MTPRCAVLDDYQDVARRAADWSPVSGKIELDVFGTHFADPDELVAALQEHQIVVAMRERTPFPREVLERLPNLRLLVTTGRRNASIDVAAATERGVVVSGTDGMVSPTVELTWSLITGLARAVGTEHAGFRAAGPQWQHTVGVDLEGAVLGVLGLGRIGSRVAEIARAFGMDVQAWSQNLTAEAAAAAGARLAPSAAELLATSRFTTIHLVLSERTRGLVGAAELAAMRPDGYLVNTSRAPIVDQDALVDALRTGRIAGAGLDVFDVEPLPADHPYRTLPNVLATPHLGYVSERNYALFFEHVVGDIAAYLAGAPIRLLTP